MIELRVDRELIMLRVERNSIPDTIGSHSSGGMVLVIASLNKRGRPFPYRRRGSTHNTPASIRTFSTINPAMHAELDVSH
jgi:hypothetical protein